MNQPFLNCLSPLFQTSQHLMQWNWAWFAWKRSVLNKAKHKEEHWFCPEAISLDVKYQCTYFPRCHLAPMVLSPSPAQTSTWTMLWRCFLAESFRETKISHSFDISTYCWDLFYFQQVLWVLISFFFLHFGLWYIPETNTRSPGCRSFVFCTSTGSVSNYKKRGIQCYKLLTINLKIRKLSNRLNLTM